ncbi:MULTISPECIES: bactofilin family protein [Pseudoalteromonas]|uniref:bactofilin family protein n=1 Tax=Pseudoalteromonas TaxID=53246 RepID=UPI001F21147B|nr:MULTISPECIES: polymer-forming cytoskeletal protein [Pseudoalteromonas]
MFSSLIGSDKAPSGLPAIISPNTVVEGQIRCEGELQVDGKVIGDLAINTLIIGLHGVIEGNVKAHIVRIKGTVNGCIDADKVMLEKTAKVHGDVMHDTLSIEAGALIEGKLTHKTEVTNITSFKDKASNKDKTTNAQ